ncbi:MAG: GTP-binding protein [Pirellulaceae bacterium]
MSKRIRYLMVGGFLGAGKTTAIARLARYYMEQGLSVGIVTNDQANDLVDTYSLRAQGFRVGEIPGACFCCNFNKLVATLSELARDEVPDIVLAEPVGSSADLVATVVEPLLAMHADLYEVGPLTVLLKPEHGRTILQGEGKAGFSPQAAYIFLKQIEEADVVTINKTDKLSPAECDELLRLVQKRFPQKNVVAVSARRGDRFNELVELLEQPAPAARSHMRIDPKTCAEGNAGLSWLNCHLTAAGRNQQFGLDQLVHTILSGLADRLNAEQAEAAHVKMLGQHEQSVTIGNLVASGTEVELSQTAQRDVPAAQLILNARVATSPQRLESVARESVDAAAQPDALEVRIETLRCFRPGRPTPTHRLGPAAPCD